MSWCRGTKSLPHLQLPKSGSSKACRFIKREQNANQLTYHATVRFLLVCPVSSENTYRSIFSQVSYHLAWHNESTSPHVMNTILEHYMLAKRDSQLMTPSLALTGLQACKIAPPPPQLLAKLLNYTVVFRDILDFDAWGLEQISFPGLSKY